MKSKVWQWLKEFSHNGIVHPLMMLVPRELGQKIHNANARWCWPYLKEEKEDVH